MQAIVGNKGSGKSQEIVNQMWYAIRHGKKCALFDTSLTIDEVKQRIVEGNFKDGMHIVEQLGQNGANASEQIDNLVRIEDPNIPVSLFCARYDSADEFLPLFGGVCAQLGGSAASNPIVFLDLLQDLPWFDGLSAASSFRDYLSIFSEIEKNSGVTIVVAASVLHSVNQNWGSSPEEVKENMFKIFPKLEMDKLTICTDTFVDDIGRRRIKTQTFDL